MGNSEDVSRSMYPMYPIHLERLPGLHAAESDGLTNSDSDKSKFVNRVGVPVTVTIHGNRGIYSIA